MNSKSQTNYLKKRQSFTTRPFEQSGLKVIMTLISMI
jgi:hypothetical protein